MLTRVIKRISVIHNSSPNHVLNSYLYIYINLNYNFIFYFFQLQSPLYHVYIYILASNTISVNTRKSYICIIYLFIKIYLVQNFRTFTYKIFYVNSCVLHLTMQTFAKTKFNYVNSSLPGKIISYNVAILWVSVSPELLYHFAHVNMVFGVRSFFVMEIRREYYFTRVYVCVRIPV